MCVNMFHYYQIINASIHVGFAHTPIWPIFVFYCDYRENIEISNID